MIEAIFIELCKWVGRFFLWVWAVPAGVIFLGYLIYILTSICKELRK